MDVSKLNSESVANRFRPIAQGLGLESLGLTSIKLNGMYVGLHKSVSATRGKHTGLAKPGQLSRIQPKTKYTRKESPIFIPRQQSCYTIVYSFKSLAFNDCLTYPE